MGETDRSMAGKSGKIYDPFKKRHLSPDELIPAAESLFGTKHRKNGEQALWYYDKAEEHYPSDARIVHGRCTALCILKRYDEAHDIIDKVMADNPDDPAAAVTMIELLKNEERHKDALVLAEESAKKWPGHAGLKADLPTMRRKIDLEERRLRMINKRLLKEPDELVKASKKSMEKRKILAMLMPEPGKDTILARDYADMYLKKCNILNSLSRCEEALEAAERSLQHARDSATGDSGQFFDAFSTIFGRPTYDGEEKASLVRMAEGARAIMAISAKVRTLLRLGRYEDALACCKDTLDEFGSLTFVTSTLDKLRKLGYS